MPADTILLLLLLILFLLLLLLSVIWRFLQRPPLSSRTPVVLYDSGRDSLNDICGGRVGLIYGPNAVGIMAVNIEVWKDPKSCAVLIETQQQGMFIDTTDRPFYRAVPITLAAGDSISYRCVGDGEVCEFRIKITRI